MSLFLKVLNNGISSLCLVRVIGWFYMVIHCGSPATWVVSSYPTKDLNLSLLVASTKIPEYLLKNTLTGVKHIFSKASVWMPSEIHTACQLSFKVSSWLPSKANEQTDSMPPESSFFTIWLISWGCLKSRNACLILFCLSKCISEARGFSSEYLLVDILSLYISFLAILGASITMPLFREISILKKQKGKKLLPGPSSHTYEKIYIYEILKGCKICFCETMISRYM